MSVNYSWTELRLLKLLQAQKGKPLITSKLAQKFYAGQELPRHAGIQITNAMRSLEVKVRYNREPFRIRRDVGRRPASFWVGRK